VSDYADDLVKQWELGDPRDRWRHTGEKPPHERFRNSDLSEPPPAPIKSTVQREEIERDIERMLICDVCGAPALFGFDVTADGIRMGDVGSWRCAEHHPYIGARFTREEWMAARAAGLLYPPNRTEEAAA
jgi:hypothetical protein